MQWHGWAFRRGDEWWHPSDNRWYVEQYAGDPARVADVVVTEDPDGTSFGWLDAEDAPDRMPRMIYPRWTLFSMCFPYGPEAEQERGRGRIVRLSVHPVEEAGVVIQ